MKALITAAIALSISPPAFAQMDHSKMPGMEMSPKPAPVVSDPHAGHDMDPPEMASENEIGSTPAPAPPDDHAADSLFDPAIMGAARKALRHENGGLINSMMLFNLAEYQARKGADGYRWEGEGWVGGDINRLVIKTEGEGSFGGPTEQAEFQLLYGRAIAPYFNLEAGVRYDIKPDPSRGYAVVGIEGIAPYWFDVGAQLFLSDKGNVLARVEGSYDQRITQSLILQPRAELNFAAQDIPANDIGSGLSDVELGFRLRYEISREFAPYIGVEWAKKLGDTARFARVAGEDADMVNFVAGIRFWF